MKYIVPEIGKVSFTCPYCGVLATQCWSYASIGLNGRVFNSIIDNAKHIIQVSKCDNCEQVHIWVDRKMLMPGISNVPMPNEYMPEKVKEIYNEAKDVFPKSAKSAAALLRLALQYLCIELGCEGKYINDDIGKLVHDGLPSQVQQALDIIRVTGNNAVHPGKMNLDDNEGTAGKLFELLNFIVDKMIVQPMEIEKLFNDLPNTYLKAIERRDKVNT